MPAFVILDRDGVINEDAADYVKSPEEWLPIPGSLEAIATLTRRNIDIFVATNQAGIARGRLDENMLARIHDRMLDAVVTAGGRIRDIAYCPHHPDDQCDCRKPAPGMLLRLMQDHGLNPADGWFVGDSLKDLRAAEAAGCRGALVLTGHGRETRRMIRDFPYIFDDLKQFVSAVF